MAKKIKAVMFFTSGGFATFDESGQQIPELQFNAFVDWAEKAKQLGYDPTGLVIQNQVGKDYKICDTLDGGFNIE